jgi:hypoxanthine phosphoribosyltransferase
MSNIIKSNLYNVGTTILAIFSIILAIYYGRKSMRLENKIKRFDCADVEYGIKKICNNTKIKEFKPNAIISISGPGSIIASLYLTQSDEYLPIFLCISQKLDQKTNLFTSENYESFTTANWITHVPKQIKSLKDKKVAIIDDTMRTGETMDALYQMLTDKYKFSKNNILRVAMFVTKTAEDSTRAPEVKAFVINESEFYIPWGDNCSGSY